MRNAVPTESSVNVQTKTPEKLNARVILFCILIWAAGGSAIAGVGVWAIKEIATRNAPESLTGEVVAESNGARIIRIHQAKISTRIMSNILERVPTNNFDTVIFRVPNTDIAYRGYTGHGRDTFELTLRKYPAQADTENRTETTPRSNVGHFAEEHSPQELDVSLDVIDGMVANAQYEPEKGTQRVGSGFVMKMTGTRTIGDTKYAVIRLMHLGSSLAQSAWTLYQDEWAAYLLPLPREDGHYVLKATKSIRT